MSERDLFIAALQITDQAERSAWLDRACAGDAALRQRLGGLLQALDNAGSLLEKPAFGLPATVAPPEPGEAAVDQVPSMGPDDRAAPESPGAVIGPYKLLQLLGEGGMGAVWMAEQT